MVQAVLSLPKKRHGPQNLLAPFRWLAILAIVFLASFARVLRAQTQLATVFGTVTDPGGAVIPRAQITLVNQSTGLKRDTVTDTAGEYHLAGLPTGNYAFRVAKEGFGTQAHEGVELSGLPQLPVLSSSDPGQPTFVS
jgi:hypothetical protein